MFLHIGNSKNIREREIIGIFDTDNATLSSPLTRRYLAAAEKRGEVESSGSDIPKSFVLYRVPAGNSGDKRSGANAGGRKNVAYRVCFSMLSTSALGGRLSRGGRPSNI